MENKHQILKQRVRQFALCILHLFQSVPKSQEGRLLGRQLLRAGTAVAANFRAVGQARSRAEFNARMGMVVEEINQVILCAKLIADAGIVPPRRLADLHRESSELMAYFAASQHRAKSRLPNGMASDQATIEPPDEPMIVRTDVAMARSADSPELSAPCL